MRLFRFTVAPDEAPDGYDAGPVLYGGAGEALLGGVDPEYLMGGVRSSGLRRLTAPDSLLGRLLDSAAPPERITILLHGFEFDPRFGPRPDLPTQPNPHNALFHHNDDAGEAEEHRTRETPWLARLGAGDGHLVAAFAYASDPGRLSYELLDVPLQELRRNARRLWRKRMLKGKRHNLFSHAYTNSWDWGAGLAALIHQLATRWGDDGPKVDILAHSLGGRVVTSGLRRLNDGKYRAALHRVGRVIHLASAVSHIQVEALAKAMAEAGAPPIQFYNFTSRSDRVLRFIGAPLAHDAGAYAEARILRAASPLMLLPMNLIRPRRILGFHGAAGHSGGLDWVDIPLDHPETVAWGRGAGLDLAGELAECRMDHWVHYTHRGNWELYRRILSGDPDWSPEAIRTGANREGRAIRDPLAAKPTDCYRPVRYVTPRPASP